MKEFTRQAAERACVRVLERRHRDGYRKFPPDEFAVWIRVTAWPAR